MTTIQISDKLRDRLKQECLYKKVNYDELVDNMFYIYNTIMSFQNEEYFRQWFERNFKWFGYEEIVENNRAKTPDFVLRTREGKLEKVELELIDKNFILHKHSKKDVDSIICVYGTKDKIKGIPVLSLVKGLKPEQGIGLNVKISFEAYILLVNYKIENKFKTLDDAVNSILLELKNLKGGNKK